MPSNDVLTREQLEFLRILSTGRGRNARVAYEGDHGTVEIQCHHRREYVAAKDAVLSLVDLGLVRHGPEERFVITPSGRMAAWSGELK